MAQPIHYYLNEFIHSQSFQFQDDLWSHVQGLFELDALRLTELPREAPSEGVLSLSCSDLCPVSLSVRVSVLLDLGRGQSVVMRWQILALETSVLILLSLHLKIAVDETIRVANLQSVTNWDHHG